MPVGEGTGYYIVERALDRHREVLRIKVNDRYVRILKKRGLTHWDDDLMRRYDNAVRRLFEQSEARVEREAMASPKYVKWECQRQRDLLLKQFLKRPRRVFYRRLIVPKRDALDNVAELVAKAESAQRT